MKKSIAPIIHPEYQLYQKGDTAYCSSLQVAQGLGKKHFHVLRDIQRINHSKFGLVAETGNQAHSERTKAIADFFKENFILTTYIDKKGEKRPMYLITQEGLNVLIKTYNSEEALYFTILYSKRFKAMQNFIRDYILAKDEFPAFTQAIADAYDEPKSYHFSNEINMIYRIVLGMDAKHFREIHGLSKGESIRPYLTDEQHRAVRKLQAQDIRLLYFGNDYDTRKITLAGNALTAKNEKTKAGTNLIAPASPHVKMWYKKQIN